MPTTRRTLKGLAGGGLRRTFGDKFVKHYVRPRQLRVKQAPYDAKRFFESWHRALPSAVSDADTISPESSPLATRYHYNAVENAIVEFFAPHPAPVRPRVLDIGSGAGHWIDFYRDVFGAGEVVGVEISEPAATALRAKYAGDEAVEIAEADVSRHDFSLGREFEIVSAIGVMFHIVDDDAWKRTVANLARHLAPGGFLVVGGQFGHATANVQFHRTDDFASFDEARRTEADVRLVNKRIRSLRYWRTCARAAGLDVAGVKRTRVSRRIRTPENNVLVLARPS